MVPAIHHLHRVACTYHGEIKLDNVVLSIDDDAVFIDFEQARHAEGCLAPEAHDVPAAKSNIDATATATIRYV
jgi:serine/threonine protein kinase